MRLKETSDFSADRLKDILSVVDEIPVLTEECLQLAYSIAERYKCPKALVLRLFLPAEMRKGGVRELYKSVAVYRKDCELSARANKQLSALEFIRENGVSIILPCAKSSAAPPSTRLRKRARSR